MRDLSPKLFKWAGCSQCCPQNGSHLNCSLSTPQSSHDTIVFFEGHLPLLPPLLHLRQQTGFWGQEAGCRAGATAFHQTAAKVANSYDELLIGWSLNQLHLPLNPEKSPSQWYHRSCRNSAFEARTPWGTEGMGGSNRNGTSCSWAIPRDSENESDLVTNRKSRAKLSYLHKSLLVRSFTRECKILGRGFPL